jgi:hypothetical protein
MTYTVTTTEKDADGNVVATVENEKTVTRRIEFTVE